MELKLVDGQTLALPDGKDAAAKFIAHTIMNHGYAPGYNDVRVDWQDFAKKFMMKDVVSQEQVRPLIQTSIQIILREPIEPLMVITGLFTRVAAQGLDVKVLGGAIGAVTADDVDEGGLYPEVFFNVAPGLQTAHINKSGIQASFTDEALRYTTWDIMAINLRLMRNALVRHKEQKAVAFLRSLGTELFNNLTPATSLLGVLTGRGIDMQPNGSFTMDDLFRAMALMTEEGYPPDVMLMNPQTFYLWIQDPILRHMFLAGVGGPYFQKWSGVSGPTDPWSNGSMGQAGPQHGQVIVPQGSPSGESPTGIAGREYGMTAQATLPGYFPWTIRIMVSPFVPFDETTGLSDVFLLSSGNVGLLLVDEDPVEVAWREEDREIQKVKIRERYGFQVAVEGMGVGVIKNVPLSRNYWDGTVSNVNMETLEEIASDTDLSDVLTP